MLSIERAIRNIPEYTHEAVVFQAIDPTAKLHGQAVLLGVRGTTAITSKELSDYSLGAGSSCTTNEDISLAEAPAGLLATHIYAPVSE